MTMQKLSVLSAVILFFGMMATVASAQENVTFPIGELGGCTSKGECRAYCDMSANAESCASFAEAHGLVSKEEAEQIRTFAGKTGPGGCEGSQCRAYCAEPTHHEECIAFAKAHGLAVPPSRAEIDARIEHETDFEPNIDEPSIDEARALGVIETQGGPGGCSTMEECRAFCDVERNMETCFAFAVEHKLMSEGEIERARAMMSKTGPGGCKGIECKAYCENPEHGNECLAFAEEQGFMKPEEAERARKLMNTTGPGGCRGFECKRYCEDATHQEECLAFAVQNGFVSEEEAGNVRQFMQHGGPGGCRTPEECKRFCLEHHEECGIMIPELNKDQMREKVENFTGPGGCKGPDECMRYCKEHPEACGQQSAYPEGENNFERKSMFEGGTGIPEGASCGTPEECKMLFEKHGGQFPGGMPEEMPSQFQHQYEDQYKEQYQQQYEEQSRQEYEKQYEAEQQEQMDHMEPQSEPSPQPTSLLPFSGMVAAVYFVASLLLGF